MNRLRSLLLPCLLILGLSGLYAGAQTITKALQLSQDGSGAFGVDVNNGVYFPGHILSPTTTNQPLPTASSGATTPTITGTDSAGTVTLAVNATTLTVTFGRAFAYVPSCLVTANGTATTTISYVPATTSLAITASGAVGVNNKYYYWCPSAS